MGLLLIYEYLQAWCQKMDFRPGGEVLPFDWVDEGKLLLFVKTEVAERPPRKGKRLADERKRRLGDELESSKKRRKLEAGAARRAVGGVAGGAAGGVAALGIPAALDDRDEELKSELCLIYNSVRGYVSTIMEL
jgi:hypothetical protein